MQDTDVRFQAGEKSEAAVEPPVVPYHPQQMVAQSADHELMKVECGGTNEHPMNYRNYRDGFTRRTK